MIPSKGSEEILHPRPSNLKLIIILLLISQTKKLPQNINLFWDRVRLLKQKKNQAKNIITIFFLNLPIIKGLKNHGESRSDPGE